MGTPQRPLRKTNRCSLIILLTWLGAGLLARFVPTWIQSTTHSLHHVHIFVLFSLRYWETASQLCL